MSFYRIRLFMLNGPSISFHYIDASCTVTSSCQAAMSRRGCHYCRLDLGAATNCQKCKSRICNARKKQVLADCFASQARQFIFRKEIEVPMMSRSNTVVQFSAGDHPTTYSWVMPSVQLSPKKFDTFEDCDKSCAEQLPNCIAKLFYSSDGILVINLSP